MYSRHAACVAWQEKKRAAAANGKEANGYVQNGDVKASGKAKPETKKHK